MRVHVRSTQCSDFAILFDNAGMAVVDPYKSWHQSECDEVVLEKSTESEQSEDHCHQSGNEWPSIGVLTTSGDEFENPTLMDQALSPFV